MQSSQQVRTRATRQNAQGSLINVVFAWDILLVQGSSAVENVCWIGGTWALVGVVISNAYLVDNINILTAPLPINREDTFEELFHENFSVHSPTTLKEQTRVIGTLIKSMGNLGKNNANLTKEEPVEMAYKIENRKNCWLNGVEKVAETDSTQHFIGIIGKCEKDAYVNTVENLDRARHQLLKKFKPEMAGQLILSKDYYGKMSKNWIFGNIPWPATAFLRRVHGILESGLVHIWKELHASDTKDFKAMLYYIDAKINKTRVFVPSTILKVWKNFVTEWKSEGCPKLFYFRTDIRDAYPSVSISKLKEILLDAGGEKGHRMVLKKFKVITAGGRTMDRESIFDDHCKNNWHSGIHSRPCLVMDKEQDRVIMLAKILERAIRVLSKSNDVKLGRRFYKFSHGLPQGWGPSSLLCSIYYGYIDSKMYLPFIESPGRFFLRIVDDYLFITPEPIEISDLNHVMKMGCEKYNIQLNQGKSETNMLFHSSERHSHHIARLKPIVIDPTINCNRRILLTTFEASAFLSFRFYAICRVVYPTLSVIKEPARAKNVAMSIRMCCGRLAGYVSRNCDMLSSTSTLEVQQCSENCCGRQKISNQGTSESHNLLFLLLHPTLF
ncbi:Telomerase reverse transcriptase [Orchesella cincta]|uniref:Telomerase reverse transcriptase n=1 Tax=Orchesella cincta TaxID=48709 RepID=A0A1D2M4R5_ORCCI|nr:Telomerase reverse transcriptase [Orchesella cincta]